MASTNSRFFLIPCLAAAAGFFGGRQFPRSTTLATERAPEQTFSATAPRQDLAKLAPEFLAWADKVERAEASELKAMYEAVESTFPKAGPSTVTAAKLFVLECWAAKEPRGLIAAACMPGDHLFSNLTGTALARWDAPQAIQLIEQAGAGDEDETEVRDELMEFLVAAWAELDPAALLAKINTPQSETIQRGIGEALKILSKTNAAEAARQLMAWLERGQAPAAAEAVPEWIADISRNFCLQNATAARDWVAGISAPDLKRFAADAVCLGLADQEGDALARELLRADTIATHIPYPAELLERKAMQRSTTLSSGLDLVNALATRIEKLLEQTPHRTGRTFSSLGGSSPQSVEVVMKSNIGDRDSLARDFARQYAAFHGGDASFWGGFTKELSALPTAGTAQLTPIVLAALDGAKAHVEASPPAALEAISALPQSCRASATNQILQVLHQSNPTLIAAWLSSMPPQRQSELAPHWQLAIALGAECPSAPFQDTGTLIDATNKLSPTIEHFVLERGEGEVAYARKLAHSSSVELAANWAAALPAPRAPNVLRSVVTLWAYQDDKTAADWVLALPAGPLRSAGANAMALALAGNDMTAAEAWRAKAAQTP